MGLLNWTSSQHYDHGGDCPCTLCGKPTPLRSHAGEPVHKVCAEDWNDNNPGASRFHSDPPRKNRKDGAR
ncbi:hypothetical protein [Streptomyces sp. NPDC005907]|uniref:hypothetical protein n=1 Tax=Streptomyces sp. NPDC005907 TaxID=3154571 RepID=UPI0033EFA56A